MGLAVLATSVAADVDLTVLAKARDILTRDSGDVTSRLGAAIEVLKNAVEACGSREEEPAPPVLTKALDGYERKLKLLSKSANDAKEKSKLLKAKEKAKKKVKRAQEEVEEDVLSSPEDRAALEVAKAALAKVEAELEEQELIQTLQGQREVVFGGLERLLERHKAGALGKGVKLEVLSNKPLVVAVDGWIGETAQKAFDHLPEVISKQVSISDEAFPSSAESIGDEAMLKAGNWTVQPGLPQLCSSPSLADAAAPSGLHDAIGAALREADSAADPLAAALATANLSALFGSGDADSCGPLSVSLDKALTKLNSFFMDASADESVDIIDAAICQAVAFPAVPVEAVVSALEGTKERKDPDASQPADWDEDEDGEWEAPMLPGRGAPELLKEVMDTGDNQLSLSECYAFSSSVELLSLRASGFGPSSTSPTHSCSDFTGEQRAGVPALTALVSITAGGTTSLPALGISRPAKAGQLLLIETTLPDGDCDPAAAYTISNGGEERVVVKKLFYADRQHSRERGEQEGPRRSELKVTCTVSDGCVRTEHVPAPGGDFVIALRQAQSSRHRCGLPPMAIGPCASA